MENREVVSQMHMVASEGLRHGKILIAENVNLKNQLASQKELINSLLEVVEFYGDGDNWNVSDTNTVWKVHLEIDEEDMEECIRKYHYYGGKKAREILASNNIREFRGV